MRESIFFVLSPLPFILLLLPILTFSANLEPIIFLFIFSLTITFIYQLVARGIESIRSNLSKREDALPQSNEISEGSTYRERFFTITHDAFFGFENDLEPISEYTVRPPFPYIVYAFWGFLTSVAVFIFSAASLSWLVNSCRLDSMTDIPVSEEALQTLPIGLIELLLTLFPMFDGLSFKGKVLIGGTTFLTGFFFLSAARNLTEISDDLHRRILQRTMSKNPYSKNELLNMAPLACLYGLLIYL